MNIVDKRKVVETGHPISHFKPGDVVEGRGLLVLILDHGRVAVLQNSALLPYFGEIKYFALDTEWRKVNVTLIIDSDEKG